MSVNREVNVCVATSLTLLIQANADRADHQATGLPDRVNRAAPTSYVRHQRRNQARQGRRSAASQAQTIPARAPQAAAAAREERLSLRRMLARCRCTVCSLR